MDLLIIDSCAHSDTRWRVISKAATAVSLYIRRPFHSMQCRVVLQHYCRRPCRRHRNDQRCQSTSTWFPCLRVSKIQGLAFTSHAYLMKSSVVILNVAPMNAPHCASEFFLARQEHCIGGRTRRNFRVVCIWSRQNRYATCESQTKERAMTCTIATLACVTLLWRSGTHRTANCMTHTFEFMSQTVPV